MIYSLHTENVGPINVMDINFGDRLNIITGDNGLGKSFILDIVWWALTRTWPREINATLSSGYVAAPKGKKGAISFSLPVEPSSIETFSSDPPKFARYNSTFNHKRQAWLVEEKRPMRKGIVLYAMPNGNFALWDSARNYWEIENGETIQRRQAAYIFSASDLWNGLTGPNNSTLCNGLIQDWANWQRERGAGYTLLENVLRSLSPSSEEVLGIGELTRINLDDVRDMPTITMSYGDVVPVVYASSAIKRIISLAYLLVWAILEHNRASELLNEAPCEHMTFLIDEVDVHLHPRWQKNILPALLNISNEIHLKKDTTKSFVAPQVQLIAITHSPLVLTSLEGLFDESPDSTKDAWFDLDFVPQKKSVELQKRDFVRQGSSSYWLTSQAFDLPSDYSEPKETIRKKLTAFMGQNPTEDDARILYKEMQRVLPSLDILWVGWRKLCRMKGWNICEE